MGRYIFIWFLPFLAAFLLCGCIGVFQDCVVGSGNAASKDFVVDEFHSVDFRIPGNLYVSQDSAGAVRAEAEDNILELLSADVVDGRLVVSMSRCFRNIKPVNVFVSMDEVRSLSVSGSGSVIGESRISAESLILSVSGSGRMDLDVECSVLDSLVSGSGDVILRGTAGNHSIVVTGSGDVKASGLSTEKTDVRITGSGNAEVNASDKLDVNILGSGSVFYTGDAAVSQSVSGSGSVMKR